MGPSLEMAALAQLKQTVGEAAFVAHLDAATRRIDELAGLLESPDAPDNARLREAAHDLIGIAGLMGLTALGSALQRFDTAADASPAAAALHEAAKESLRALRRLQAPAAAGC
jgi:HPt (histidine-containing phosphotransfer) domain-containing protein